MYISTELTSLEIHLQGPTSIHKSPNLQFCPLGIWTVSTSKKTNQTVRLGEGYRSSTQLQEAQGGGEGWFEGIFCCGFSSVGSEEETRRGPIFFFWGATLVVLFGPHLKLSRCAYMYLFIYKHISKYMCRRLFMYMYMYFFTMSVSVILTPAYKLGWLFGFFMGCCVRERVPFLLTHILGNHN